MIRLFGSRSGTRRTARREERRRAFTPAAMLERPEHVAGILVILSFAVIVSVIILRGREEPIVSLGQLMRDARVCRVSFAIPDDEATARKREEARLAATRLYQVNDLYLSRLLAAILGLPPTVHGKGSLSEISEEVVREYALTEPGVRALQAFVVDGQTTASYEQWCAQLRTLLARNPVIDSREFQNYVRTPSRGIVRDGMDGVETILGTAIELRSEVGEEFASRMNELVDRAGFPGSIAPFIRARLLWEPKETIVFDPSATEERAKLAAAQVPPVVVEHQRGEVIYQRGDRLSASQINTMRQESLAWQAQASTISIWAPRLGVLGLVGILSLFATSIVVMGYPRIVRNALRVLAIALLMAGMLGVSVILTQAAPQLLAPSVIAPVLFSATILLLAYDRRLAIFLSTIQCALVAMALNLRIEWFVLLIAGCGAMIAQLREVRQRNTLIRASAVTALIMAIGSILLDLLTIPAPSEAWLEIVRRGVAVLAAPLAVGFLLLGILPSIERLFDITTGMTLAELRDPARPLLRELQQHAPGTYNHSLQVAAIAEAAADAIGADSLLTYVGAMYHDIGKMNKPEYFVENQAGGFNRHSRLRPAMSLLVIVGHVKDGMELAREYGLPRSIQHFIESHHGTTLVEYFYHAAREQAEGEGSGPVNEIEFRYPGPRPHTREAAILMLADAVESTTRTLTDPSPSRIENLVRDLSRRRLLDDQFSECDLTFSELRQIEDAMIARLCAIHHTRISYPKEEQEDEEDQPEARRAAT